MADLEKESADLAQSEQHIADGHRRVERQERLVARLSAIEADASVAVRFLDQLKDQLAEWERHRLRILEAIERAEAQKRAFCRSPLISDSSSDIVPVRSVD